MSENTEEKKEKTVKLIGPEIWIPIGFLTLAVTLAIIGAVTGKIYGLSLAYVALLVLIAAGLAYASLFPLQKVWEYRQIRWMEKQARDEREELRDKSEDIRKAEEKIKEELNKEKEKIRIALLKQLKDLKPSSSSVESESAYYELHDSVKTDLTNLLKKHFKED
jgi:biopolymer transport protein ExbB/TolQ